MNNSTPTWLPQIKESLPIGQYLLVKETLADQANQIIAAEQERDKICRDALVLLAGAGVITPEKGFPNLHELLAEVRVGLRDKNKEIKATEQRAKKAEAELESLKKANKRLYECKEHYRERLEAAKKCVELLRHGPYPREGTAEAVEAYDATKPADETEETG